MITKHNIMTDSPQESKSRNKEIERLEKRIERLENRLDGVEKALDRALTQSDPRNFSKHH